MNMWTLLESLFIAAVVLLSNTEFCIPLIKGCPLFGSFRKTQPVEPKLVLPSTYMSGGNSKDGASLLESIPGMKLRNQDKK